MSDLIQPNDMTPRETAILKLEDVKQELLAANDTKAAEMIEPVIFILGDLSEFNDDTQSVVKTALASLGQAISQAGSRLKNASDVTIDTASQLATQASDGIASTKDLLVDKANELRQSTLVAGASSGIAIAAETLAKFAENLDWSTIDPTKYLYAGTRGISRGMDQAAQVWQSIPEPLRALGPEELLERLDGFDWSHKIPHSEGGSSDAANGVFELANLNRSRGAEAMTPAEVSAAQQVLTDASFRAVLSNAAAQVFKGAAVGAAVACVISCLEHGLECQQGKIDQKEMFKRIGHSVALSAALGGTVAGIMAVVALAFPAILPVAAPLMIPLAVLGFCATGMKVARLTKEWYELLRHVEVCERLGMLSSTFTPQSMKLAAE